MVKIMKWLKSTLNITTHNRGFHEITDKINAQIKSWNVEEGIIFLFLQHTSASLVINEDYDPSARRDMENFFEKIIPDGASWYEHTIEGQDDSPAHLRTMVTHTHLSIPVDEGRLTLGTWQGIFLAEHRQRGHRRQIQLRMLSVDGD